MIHEKSKYKKQIFLPLTLTQPYVMPKSEYKDEKVKKGIFITWKSEQK